VLNVQNETAFAGLSHLARKIGTSIAFFAQNGNDALYTSEKSI